MNAYKDNNNGNVKKTQMRNKNRREKEGIHKRKTVKYYESLKQKSGDVLHDIFLNVKQSCAQ